jgi:hypothetical protein
MAIAVVAVGARSTGASRFDRNRFRGRSLVSGQFVVHSLPAGRKGVLHVAVKVFQIVL